MKKILTIISFILFTSCFVHKGTYVDNKCRPKNPNFKLSKSNFHETGKIFFKKIYLSSGNIKSFGFGFYSDGHLVHFASNGTNNLTQNDVAEKNWQNAQHVGYWRTEGNKIKIEYFVCGNSGVYIEKEDEIKNDTLIFYRDCGTTNPFKSVKCNEKFVLSDLYLK